MFSVAITVIQVKRRKSAAVSGSLKSTNCAFGDLYSEADATEVSGSTCLGSFIYFMAQKGAGYIHTGYWLLFLSIALYLDSNAHLLKVDAWKARTPLP